MRGISLFLAAAMAVLLDRLNMCESFPPYYYWGVKALRAFYSVI